jgi:hypothetical protein
MIIATRNGLNEKGTIHHCESCGLLTKGLGRDIALEGDINI